MKLAVLMDPLSYIKPYKDSTILLLKRAQELGWDCVFFTINDLYSQDGAAFASVYKLTINDLHSSSWATSEFSGLKNLSDFDIIMMRKDPPFNLEYIYATYALELAEKKGVLVVNKPQSLRDANEKFFTLNFPQCCPPSLITSNLTKLIDFWYEHKQVIFKPLSSMGGDSVFFVDENGYNLSVILEVLTSRQLVSIMAQRYIPEIHSYGDKRILIINGEVIPFALARYPASGELRANLAAGGSGKVVPISSRDQWICNEIALTLYQKGLYFVGIDVIGDYLTEINVTSPTCLCEISSFSGLDIAGDFLKNLAKLKTS